MKHKTVYIILFLMLCAAAGAATYYYFHELPEVAHDAEDITDLTTLYEADEEIEDARKNLPSAKPAEIIVPNISGENEIAIVIDGLPPRDITARLIDLLKKHSVRTVFFVEGHNSAKESETIELIAKSENEIGNYTFVGVRAPQKLPMEDFVEELCRTQKVINVQCGKNPKYFRAPSVEFTDPLLRAVTASKILYAVRANVVLPRDRLISEEAADEFMAEVPPGSIVSIMTDEPVDAKPYEPKVDEERPAIDKKPSVHTLVVHKPKKDTLVEEVEQLILAAERNGTEINPLSKFRHIAYVPEEKEDQQQDEN